LLAVAALCRFAAGRHAVWRPSEGAMAAGIVWRRVDVRRDELSCA
jgi:hypothetical protein